MHQPPIVLSLIVLLVLGSSASSAQVSVTDSVTGVTTELALPPGTRPLSKGRIAWAATLSANLGMGIGHWLIEQRHDGRVFRRTQLAGIVLTVAGTQLGEIVAYPGIALYIGSRAWELADVFVSSAAHNAKVAADRRALDAARKPRVGVLPLIGTGRRGVALSLKF